MSKIINTVSNDRLLGIWSLFIRSFPYHLAIMAFYIGLILVSNKLSITKTVMGQFVLAFQGMIDPIEALKHYKVILTGFILLQTTIYTLFTTLYYRVNEMVAKGHSFDFQFIFKSFFHAISKKPGL